ncbi:MAG: IS66 family transposase [Acidobacteria bacterium]|nr:IS66 family transposase [Acidobacteriota bacterium]
MRQSPERLSLNMHDLDEVLERARAILSPEDYRILKAVVNTPAYVTRVAEDRKTTIVQLRRLLFGSSSEKTSKILLLLERLEEEPATDSPSEASSDAQRPEREEEVSPPAEAKRPPQGHGRNGAQAYPGAEKISVPHQGFRSGDACPECRKGKVYGLRDPGLLVRMVGQAPLQACVYELEKLRCNLCGEVFTADPPKGVGPEKYDATAGSMIALLKYGSGLPFHRQQQLQASLGIPPPSSTQWQIVRDLAGVVAPAYQELVRQAAQGEVLHNDDTAVKILELAAPGAPQISHGEDPEEDFAGRTGIFTSGIVSTRQARKIALFFTGRKHAGENLADVLAQRASELGPPIQMSDALSRNLPGQLEAIVANCLAHSRRKFIDMAESFPAECRHVLEALAKVYRNEALTREQEMTAHERLSLHQAESAPVMEALHGWLRGQFEEKRVEPNSGLGRAISYILKRWKKLTLFLREPGAPLDNNVCERALKKVILHRKNALFFKTQKGAQVGDIFMSLIYTCQLSGANPFDYLTELQKHAQELSENPAEWMPWNYRHTPERDGASREPPG